MAQQELYVKLEDVREAFGEEAKEIIDGLKTYEINDDKLIDNVTVLEQTKEILDYLNKTIGANYKATTQKNRTLIKARLREGYSVEDFKIVIDRKARAWLGDETMQKYLRPETLFGVHFEGYLNEQETYKFSGNSTKKESTYERIQRLAREGAFNHD